MAVAPKPPRPLDAAGLAAALGISMPDTPMAEARRLLGIAEALVTAYLHDAPDDTDCPLVIRNEAIIRTAGHVQNRAGYGRVDGAVVVGGLKTPLAPMARSAVRQSGAAALLAPFVRRTA